jgi:hypothetical protein
MAMTGHATSLKFRIFPHSDLQSQNIKTATFGKAQNAKEKLQEKPENPAASRNPQNAKQTIQDGKERVNETIRANDEGIIASARHKARDVLEAGKDGLESLPQKTADLVEMVDGDLHREIERNPALQPARPRMDTYIASDHGMLENARHKAVEVLQSSKDGLQSLPKKCADFVELVDHDIHRELERQRNPQEAARQPPPAGQVIDGLNALGEKVMHALHLEGGPAPEEGHEEDIADSDRVIGGFLPNGEMIAYLWKDDILLQNNNGQNTIVHTIQKPLGLVNKEFDVAGLSFRQKRWSDDVHVLDHLGKELLNCQRSEGGYTINADAKPVATFNRGTLDWDTAIESIVPGVSQIRMFAIGCAVNRLMTITL